MTELKNGPDLGKLQMVKDITLGKKPPQNDVYN